MKRFVLILFAIFTCVIANAEQITINWLNEDKTINQTTTCSVGGDVVMPNNIPQKRGYTFKGYVDNYTPVEYIEGTGSQWIDTGYKANGLTGVKAKIAVVKILGDNGVFGHYQWGTICLGYNSKGDIYICNFSSDAKKNISLNLQNNDLLDIDINKGTFYLSTNGVGYTTFLAGGNTVTRYTISIFGIRNGSSSLIGSVAQMKLYYFQIYDNDVLVRDFIPVVDSKGVACLYDKIEHKFYYNAGSGEFIAGPVI